MRMRMAMPSLPSTASIWKWHAVPFPAAEEARAAIIINLGVGQMGNHAHSEEMVPMIKELAARATVPVALNLDHGGRLEDIARCLNLGFSSIMNDASSFDFEENIRRTAIVSAMHTP